MAARKSGEEENNSRIHVPAQQDEEDIVEEVGGVRDEETGELVVDEEKIRELGAIDAETVRENRRIKAVANKQKTGKKGVSFDTSDPLVKYDGLLKTWGPNSIYIRVKRLTGAQVVYSIRTCPRSGEELLDALVREHGRHPEAEYQLEFRSTDGHQWRGSGRITLRDTQLQGQPMHYPPPYGAQPGYPPQQAPVQQAPTPQQQQPPQPQSPFALLQEALDTVQRLQGMQPQPQQPQPQPAAPQQTFVPQQPSLDEALQLIESLGRMTRGQGQRNPPVSPPQVAPGPQLPTTAPPPGHFWAWLPESQCVVAMPQTRAAPNPTHRSPPYYPHGDPNEHQAPPWQRPPPQRPSSSNPLRDAIGIVRDAVAAAEEFDSLLPGRRGGYVDEEPAPQNEDSPVVYEKVGDIETIRNRDGTLRWGETIGANVPGALKWFGEQMKKVEAERQRREQPRQFDAAQVEEQPQEDLPPPPPMPPPIQQTRRSWGAS